MKFMNYLLYRASFANFLSFQVMLLTKNRTWYAAMRLSTSTIKVEFYGSVRRFEYMYDSNSDHKQLKKGQSQSTDLLIQSLYFNPLQNQCKYKGPEIKYKWSVFSSILMDCTFKITIQHVYTEQFFSESSFKQNKKTK